MKRMWRVQGVVAAIVAAVTSASMAGAWANSGAPSVHRSTPASPTVGATWSKLHFDAANSGFNPSETILNSSNVASLHVIWHFLAGSLVQSTPAVANDVLYVGSQDHNLYALNSVTGKELWSFTAHRRILTSSPAVAGSLVYVTDEDQYLYAVNATSGIKQWTFTAPGIDHSSPSVVNGFLYLASSDGILYALNASTGGLQWQFNTGTGQPLTTPAVAGSDAFVGSADGHVYAVNLTNHLLAWSFSVPLESTSAPTVVGGLVYVGAGHRLYAINAANGRRKWRTRIATLDVDTSPAVANGVVYIGTEDGNFFAFNASSGAGIWSASVAQPFGDTAPAVANGVVYAKTGGSAGALYAFDAGTGAQLFTRSLDGLSSAIVVNGMVYVGSAHDHRLYAFGLG
jgi:eukaryotic-like serine/threonine-protein kinase